VRRLQRSLPIAPRRSGFRSSRVCLCLSALLLSASPALAAWKVTLDGTDVSAVAAPMDSAGAPVVNAVALAPVLGMQAQVTDGELRLRDPRGTEWRGRNGDVLLTTTGRSLSLGTPLLLQAAAAYLSLDAVAELAQLQLSIDRSSGLATLASPHRQTGTAEGDWQTFTLEKTPEERAATSGVSMTGDVSRARTGLVNLPPAYDRLSLGLGLGYVQGADWGMELTGTGKGWGADVVFSSLLTRGAHGLRGESGRLSVVDGEMGWSAELGDLFSDVRGSTRGFRFAWRAGDHRWPAVSVYLGAPGAGRTRPVLAYRDEIPLRRDLWLGGEVATDGSFLAKGRFQKGPLSLYAYHRSTAGARRGEMGASFAYDLGRGLSVYGGVSRSNSGDRHDEWRQLALRYPLWRGVAVTLEHTDTASSDTKNTMNAAMLTMPAGPIQLLARYQFGNTSLFQVDPQFDGTGYRHRELVASAGYHLNRRMRFNYQVNTRWQENGQPTSQEQLVSTIQLSNRTQFHLVSGFPQVMSPDQLRFRLDHTLWNGLALSLDYGMLTPYQGTSIRPGERGFMLMLRSQWNAPTPARGAEIKGRVIDPLGHPVRGAIVRLNDYQALADEDGRYTFRHVPAGEYEIHLDESSLPADYKSDTASKQLTIDRRGRRDVNFRVIPLNTITGHVYVDTNGNGKYDIGEGVRGVVIRLGEHATATDEEGAFSFFNTEPGQHTVRLDTDRLPSGYAPASPVEQTVDLLPDRSLSDITFRLVKREKGIIFQPVP
jgi:hypothetical protein